MTGVEATRGRAAVTTPTYLGHVVAAVFGLVFVALNGGALGTGLRLALTAAAVVGLLLVLVAFVRTERARGGRPPAAGSGARYWTVVAVEAVALFGGLAVVTRFEPAAALGWVALVVGVHFLPLSRLWPEGRAQLLGIGAAMTLLGVLGLVLAFTTHDADLVALVSGVLSGLVLLVPAVLTAVRTLRSG